MASMPVSGTCTVSESEVEQPTGTHARMESPTELQAQEEMKVAVHVSRSEQSVKVR